MSRCCSGWRHADYSGATVLSKALMDHVSGCLPCQGSRDGRREGSRGSGRHDGGQEGKVETRGRNRLAPVASSEIRHQASPRPVSRQTATTSDVVCLCFATLIIYLVAVKLKGFGCHPRIELPFVRKDCFRKPCGPAVDRVVVWPGRCSLTDLAFPVSLVQPSSKSFLPV